MGSVVLDREIELDGPMMIEGLPGVGLVGKIATDHIIETMDMERIGYVDCNGLPKIAVYGSNDHEVETPVRIYATPDRELIALQSDVPVSRQAAPDFAETLIDWVESIGAIPLFLSGRPVEDQEPDMIPAVTGIATGDGASHLDAHDVDPPEERGVIGGPTGALVNRASLRELDACGLIVESDPQFPDPAAARQLITSGIEPIADIEVTTDDLVERAEEIRSQKEQLARRMQQAAEEESTQAQPLRMYQ